MAGGNDIFGYKRSPKPQGVFSSEGSLLEFGSVGDVGHNANTGGYLVQNWAVQYNQQVQELFEIGSNSLYWAKGRPVGQGQLGRVIGANDADSPTKGFFPEEAYDICKGGALLVLKAHGGHCDSAPSTGGGVVLDKAVNIKMDGCVVTSIGFSMNVGDVRLMENFAWRFAYMDLS